MRKRNILLTIAYDGTGFNGWQRQAKGRTIQGVLEKALEVLHKKPVTLTGSGRTDAGVHARGMTANFHSDIESIPEGKFAVALNTLLPQDVRVIAGREVAENFHARFDALWREYTYAIAAGKTEFAGDLRYAYAVDRCPDAEVLNRMAAAVVGTHSFDAFAAAGDDSVSKIRTIGVSSFYMKRGRLIYRIVGNAFLMKMIRNLVGTMLELERNGFGKTEFQTILEGRDRKRAGATAPPQGLVLERVMYGNGK